MNTLRRLLLPLAIATLAVAASGAGWLLGTEAGARWMVTRLERALPERIALTVEQVTGTLRGPLTLTGVTLGFGAHTLTVRHLQLDWRLAPLLIGRLDVTRLEAEEVVLVLRRSARESTPQKPLALPPRLRLPLHVRFGAVSLKNATLRHPALTEPLLFTELAFAGSADARGFLLERLRARGAWFDVEGSARLADHAPYAAQADLHGAWRPPHRKPFSGRLTAAGSLAALRWTLALEAPFRLAGEGVLRDLPSPSGWDGRLEFADFDTAALGLAGPPLRAAGTLRLHGDRRGTAVTLETGLTFLGLRFDARAAGTLAARHARLSRLVVVPRDFSAAFEARGNYTYATRGFVLEGTWRDLAAAADAPPLSRNGRFALAGSPQALTVTLDAAVGETTTPRLTARGRLAFAAGRPPRFTARLDWHDLVWPAAHAPRLRSAHGTARLDGDLDAYTLRFDAVLGSGNWPDGTLVFEAAGGRAGLAVERLAARWLGGTVDGTGELRWRGERRVHLALAARGLNPGRLAAGYAGALDARVTFEAHAPGATPVMRLLIEDVTGEVRGQPLAGAFAFVRRGEVWTLAPARLQLGAASLVAQGEGQARRARLTWRLDVPDLGSVLPEGGGRITTTGEFAGEFAMPRAAFTLEADGLAWREFALARARLAARLDATSETPSDLALALEGLRHGRRAVERFTVHGAGRAAGHEARLELRAGDYQVRAKLAGGWRPAGGWHGVLEAFEGRFAALGDWLLAAPAEVSVAGDHARLTDACLVHEAARACLQGGWGRASGWSLAGTLTAFALESLAPYLPAGLHYTGRFDGQLVFNAPPTGPPRGEAVLALDAGRVLRRDVAGEVPLLAFDSGTARVAVRAGLLDARLAFTLADGGSLEADLTTGIDPRQPPEQRPLHGRFVVETDNFALVPVLVPELRTFSGRLRADFALAGTQAAPRFSGFAHFENGHATLPLLGLTLANVNVELEGKERQLELVAGADSGAGRLVCTARLVSNGDGWHAEATFTGRDVLVLNTPDARVVVSPDIKTRVQGRRVEFEGSLLVPEARLAPRDLRGAQQVSADEIIVGAGGRAARAKRWEIHARLRTTLGDAVRVEGFGLKARITGTLEAIDVPGQLTLGNGELRVVEGEYEAYGQALTIERGRLLFNASPVADPGLDIRAVRVLHNTPDAEELTVGFDLRGTLRQPELRLFSEPALPPSKALSYLALGHALEEASASEQQALRSTNEQWSMVGGELIARELGRRLGIEDVTIEPGQRQEEAALFLGTYLSPRLYVSYGIGLFDDRTTVRLRYRLSEQWSVEAESGVESGADIKYTIER